MKIHETTDYHKQAVSWDVARKLKPGQSQAEKALNTMNVKIYEKLERMFRTCHGLAKHNRPMSDFVFQCDLDEAKGLEVGETYRNREKAQEFSNFIASSAFSNLPLSSKSTNSLQ